LREKRETTLNTARLSGRLHSKRQRTKAGESHGAGHAGDWVKSKRKRRSPSQRKGDSKPDTVWLPAEKKGRLGENQGGGTRQKPGTEGVVARPGLPI